MGSQQNSVLLWKYLVTFRVQYYSLFVSGVVGTTEHLCDWAALDVSLFAFELERWEEEERLWYCNVLQAPCID